MALSRTFPVDKGLPTPADLRRLFGGFLPREGVLPDPTVIASGVAIKGSGWAISARAFTAVVRRRTAAFAQSYGSALVANDATVSDAWTIPGAPSSGSRIDVLWISVIDPSQGDVTTTPGGETVPRAVPVFGITSGVAATSPTRPALPAGVLELAEVTTPSGAASVASSTLRHSHAIATPIGGIVLARSLATLPAPAFPGERALALDTEATYIENNGAWRASPSTAPLSGANGYVVTASSIAQRDGDLVTLSLVATRSAGIDDVVVTTLPADFAPADAVTVYGVASVGGAASPVVIVISTSGQIKCWTESALNTNLSIVATWKVAD